jgi:selenocysteine lyase/cysteine desulfurase
LVDVINRAKADLALFMNAPKGGQFFVGESGTELLFRLIRTACVNVAKGAKVIGSSIEHPASRSAAQRWAGIAGLDYVNVQHDNATGLVTADDYAAHMTPDVAVATVVHASPVTGMGMDVAAISKAIRAVAPDCFIIVDGIQHAAHGQLDLAAYNVDGYAISPYKVFSRHGYGIAWISGRMTALPHDMLIDAPADGWEFGTRDTGSYATMADVVSYFDWLGGEVSDVTDTRARIEAAGQAIHSYETHLTQAMIHGTGNLPGLADMDHVTVLGGEDNPAREGLVSIVIEGMASPDVVTYLNNQGIRTHTRKADHYSGNVLVPLGLTDCIRISLCHYNTLAEVSQCLEAIRALGE